MTGVSRRAPRAPRRSQQERREATRTRLLEATVATLVERGYSGTTTLAVEQRAGTSRGARLHYYRTKATLLAAAVDYLYEQLSNQYEAAFGQAAPESDPAGRLRSGLRLLWSIYRRPDYAAVLELTMAARTDDELAESLRQVVARHRALAVAAATRYFGVEGEPAVILVELIHAVLIGLLMQRTIDPADARHERALSLLEEAVIRHLPPAQSAAGRTPDEG